MKDLRQKGIDQFGRNYPDKILLKNGKTVIGQCVVVEIYKDQFSIKLFKEIENIDDWKKNKIQYGTKKYSIDGKDIIEISTYNDYEYDNEGNKINLQLAAEEPKQLSDFEYQKKNLEAIYSAASMAPVFKSNPKHCTGKFADLTPYISYNDVMSYKFIIRGRPNDEHNSFDFQEREIIAEYDSLESLVNDGWRLD